jgi:hypothetical protein
VFTFLTSSNILKLIVLEYITMITFHHSHEEQINLLSLRRSNDIYLFSNIFSEDMCNKLVDYTNENAKYHLKLGQRQNVQGYEDLLQFKNPLFKPISSKIVDIGKFIQKKYMIPFGSFNNNYNHEGITIRKIYGPTKLHGDGPIADMSGPDVSITVEQIRTLSVIIALNGDYDGGEIVFPCQNFKTKLKQGEAIVFPPYWTHPHYTEELKNNTFRYTINTWLGL